MYAKLIVISSLIMFTGVSVAQDSDGNETESVDWLIDRYWLPEFKEGLLTTNKEDLTRFEITGSTIDKLIVGKFSIENNAGVFHDGIVEPGVGTDTPASILFRINNEVVLGAKGLDFSFEQRDNIIIVQHWNGEFECSYATWWFEYNQTEIKFVGSEYLDYYTKEKCTR